MNHIFIILFTNYKDFGRGLDTKRILLDPALLKESTSIKEVAFEKFIKSSKNVDYLFNNDFLLLLKTHFKYVFSMKDYGVDDMLLENLMNKYY